MKAINVAIAVFASTGLAIPHPEIQRRSVVNGVSIVTVTDLCTVTVIKPRRGVERDNSRKDLVVSQGAPQPLPIGQSTAAPTSALASGPPPPPPPPPPQSAPPAPSSPSPTAVPASTLASTASASINSVQPQVTVASAPSVAPTSQSSPSVVTSAATGVGENSALASSQIVSSAVASASATSSASSGSGATCEGVANECSGDVTHWDGGLGACGWDVNTNSDMQIALPVGLMGSESNGNPYCGRSLTIVNPYGKGGNGGQIQATVGDKCMGCEGRSIDLTNALFAAIAVTADGAPVDGRGYNFVWYFND